MNKYNSLIKNTFLYAIGPVLNRLLSIILIPYYTFHFSTSELGYYDLIITSGSLVIAVSTLKIADALYRWLIDCEADENKKVSAISNSFFIIIISCVVVGATFALLGSNFIKYPNLVYAYISSTILLSYLQQMLRGLGYLKIYSLLAFINCFLLVLFNFIFLGYLHYKLNGVLLAVVIANIISIFYILFQVNFIRFIKLNAINKDQIKAMVNYAAPLIFNAINLWFLVGFDRYVIVTYLGLDFNGIYAVAIKFSSILLLLNSFIIPAWQDYILTSKNLNVEQPNFNKFFNNYIVLQLSLMIFFMAISKFILLFFVDVKFIDAWNYLPILLLGFSFQAFTSFLGTLFLIEKNTKILFITTLAGGIVNVALSLILVHNLKLYAPAVGLLSGFLVTFFIRYFLLKNKMSLHINRPPIILLALFFIIITGIAYSSSKILIILSIILSAIILFFANKKLWVKVFNYSISLLNINFYKGIKK